MKDLKKRVPAGLLILAATTILSAQQPPTQTPKKPAQNPTFRLATDVVSTNVIVRDASGRFIPDLTMNDFQVFEDGVPQKITNFAVSVGGRVLSEVVPVKETVREGLILPKTSQAPDVPGRIFIIFIDDLHLQPGDSPMVKQVLKQIRDTLLHENDLVGLVSSGYSSVSFDLSPDPRHLRFNQAIEKTLGAGKTPKEIIDSMQTIEGPAGLRADAYTAFKTAYDILDQAEKVTNRVKAFIYVSSGYDFNPFTDARYQAQQDMYAQPPSIDRTDTSTSSKTDPLTALASGTGTATLFRNPFEMNGLQFSEADLASALGELVRRARRANVVFYPVDPRGLVAGVPINAPVSQEEWYDYVNTSLTSLDVIAGETGGRCICRTNDFKRGLEAVDNDTSDYYMIGYESGNPNPTPIRRRIEIKIARPGAKAIYKDSYTIKR